MSTPKNNSKLIKYVKNKLLDLEIGKKKYNWCACGMSSKQPFCDNNHEGSKFKPVTFILQEPVKQLELCGCKFTTEAPFCDKISCGKATDFYNNLGEMSQIYEEEMKEKNESRSLENIEDS